MSFILDALKKSEIERQRQTVPGLMDTRIAGRRNRLPIWAVALGVLLGINLLVLSFVLWRKDAPAAHASRPAAAAAATEIAVPSADGAAPLQSPIAHLGSAGGAGSSVNHTLRHADPLLTEPEARDENQEVLPTISEISLTGAQALPELHLDVHVYATKPSDRFVYINMRKYHEGATLQEGPTLERIRRDGVVLNFQGLRFILPRQP
jgi:general secretion pathway protein B